MKNWRNSELQKEARGVKIIDNRNINTRRALFKNHSEENALRQRVFQNLKRINLLPENQNEWLGVVESAMEKERRETAY
jgi:hypothetical protein